MLQIALLNGRLSDFFSDPVVGVIGSIASIISLFLAVYFYLKAKQVRELVYQVNPAKAVVLRAGQASKLKVTFEDVVIAEDITAAQIALWNQGNQSVKPENILKPIVIYTEDNRPILEASIRKTSRDFIELALDETDIQQGRLAISWKILEQHDGGVIQLIYLGDTKTEINVDGVVEGQKKIKQQYRERFRTSHKPDLFDRLSTGAVGRLIAVSILAFGVLFAILSAFILFSLGRFNLRDDWIAIVLPVYFLIIGLFFWRISKGAAPPFGY